MQIIISPISGGENFLLDIDSGSDVKELRVLVAQKLASVPEGVKLVCEGLELADGATLAEYFVQPLSTIRVVLTNGSSAVAAVGGGSAAPAADSHDNQIISDAEMARAIVITGMPEAEPTATERAVYDVFARYGEIARLIFQGDGHGAQHAVLVYHREPSAAAALAAAGTPILGQPVNVILANNLAAPRGPGGKPVPRPTHASDVVADFLAKGMLFGVQGVAHVRRFDETNGLSHRVRIVASEGLAQANSVLSQMDRRYQVSQTVSTTYEAAARQAMDLDQKYRITEKAKQTAQAALAQANSIATTVASKAMANPQVASAVSTASNILSQAMGKAQSVVGGAVAQAKVDMANIDAKLKAEQQAAVAAGRIPPSLAGATGMPSMSADLPPVPGPQPTQAQFTSTTTLEDTAPAPAAAEQDAAVSI